MESNKDRGASCECISYANSKYFRPLAVKIFKICDLNIFKLRLKTICSVEQKLTIQANDEVFQATKEKVKSVDRNREKQRETEKH